MTVSLECLMQCEDVSVAFSLEASTAEYAEYVGRGDLQVWNRVESMNCAMFP
jgi:hypothetical protein